MGEERDGVLFVVLPDTAVIRPVPDIAEGGEVAAPSGLALLLLVPDPVGSAVEHQEQGTVSRRVSFRQVDVHLVIDMMVQAIPAPVDNNGNILDNGDKQGYIRAWVKALDKTGPDDLLNL